MSSTPIIYKSPFPDVSLPKSSVFTYLFDPSFDSLFSTSSPAFIDAETGLSVSRGQLKSLSLCLAYGLRNHPAVSARRGDTLMIYAPNSLSFPLAVFGAIAGGLRCTLANSSYTSHELAFQYSDSGAHFMCTNPAGLKTVRDMLREVGTKDGDKRIILLDDSLEWAGGSTPSSSHNLLRLEDLLKLGKLDREEQFNEADCHTTVLLCYSSGTTGKPKGVETTHHNLTSVLRVVHQAFPRMEPGKDSILALLPFYHIYGAVKLVLFPFVCGVPSVVIPRFDPVKFCKYVEQYKITTSLIVPPVLVILARHPAVDTYDMSTLRILFSGAAPLGAALVKQVTDRFLQKRGSSNPLYILQGYGLTETSPTCHLLPIEMAKAKAGGIGILLPNLQVRLVDEDASGNEVEALRGGPGELWLKGPTVMKGYLNNLSATKDSITEDGWFKTGDVAIVDKDGCYFIVDRRKELIKYKGFQVPPAELESVLLSHPDIADAAVIGVENLAEATEVPRAYVVHANSSSLQNKSAFEADVAKWMQTKVARHKYLRGGVSVIDAIPKSASGKILRRDLRDRAKSEQFKAKL